jgi:hypothetical protein
VSALTDYNAPRNDTEDAPNFRQSRFDVASVVRPQLDNLIQMFGGICATMRN